MNWLLVGIFSYLVIQFAVGIWVSKRIKNESDYIVAGRTLGLGLAAFSIFATWFGAESIQGAAGEIYTDGFSGGSSDPFGYVLCIVFMGLVFAGPLWSRGFTTFGDLFRQRYSVTVERFAIVQANRHGGVSEPVQSPAVVHPVRSPASAASSRAWMSSKPPLDITTTRSPSRPSAAMVSTIAAVPSM